MATKTLSPQDLDDRLESLAAAMAEAEQDVNDLSLPAAGGDADAVTKLAKAQAKVVSLTRDRDILMRARSSAVKQAEAVSEAEAQAARAASKKQAQELAAKLIEMSKRVDVLAAEYATILDAMPQIERDLHRALHDAGEPVFDSGVVGRKNLAAHAVTVMQTSPMSKSLRARPCADLAAVGWGYLNDQDI